MSNWFMLNLIGNDQSGIVAQVTNALYKGGCHLGETSMMRLGGNFTMMMMTSLDGTETDLEKIVKPVAEKLELHVHIDSIEGRLHQHVEPNVRVTVFGADRAGIVAQVTGVLSESGMNILDLESDVGGTEDKPIYIMYMEGLAEDGIEALRTALEALRTEGIDVDVEEIETLIG
ncbi:MAG: ACT domain-containing protein [Nitrosopumilus sp.]|nr:ACT domain-containing protein [Gammaproteobacteria bacterium]MDH5593577.1 ACT domain-containing protein [Gammaproteobacteria bacterium]MDH5666167.1 ACT domain-containing protein [Nitrosopumilus sp.]